MPAGRLAVRCAVFVEVEAKAAALGRREKRDRHTPGDFPAGLAKRGAVEGREIGEVVVRDRSLAAARPSVPRMLRHEMRPRPEGFRDQVDAGGGGDVADFGRDVVKRCLGARIDGHRHVMLAKDQALGFQIVLCEFQLLREADSPVVGGLHQAQLPLDPACHDIGVDRHEGVGDHHVDGQVQLVEHQAVGLGGVVLDCKDRAELVAHGAVGERDGRAAEGDAGISDILGDHAQARPREERMLLACVEGAEEAEKLAGAGGQQARLQLVEGRQEKPDDLVELAQAAGCVRCMSRTRRPQTEGQTAPRLGALQDRQGQRLVAQAGLTQMRAPALVHGGGEPLARDGRQGHVDRFRDLVQVEGKLRPYLRDDPGKKPADPVEMSILARGAVHPLKPDALHQLVAACPDRPVGHEAHIRQHGREPLLALDPCGQSCQRIELLRNLSSNSITGHSCRLRGACGSPWAGFPAR